MDSMITTTMAAQWLMTLFGSQIKIGQRLFLVVYFGLGDQMGINVQQQIADLEYIE